MVARGARQHKTKKTTTHSSKSKKKSPNLEQIVKFSLHKVYSFRGTYVYPRAHVAGLRTVYLLRELLK